jgi:hypothetical protein
MTDKQLSRLSAASNVDVWDSRVHIKNLTLEDAVLAEYLLSTPDELRNAEVAKILAVGVRGLTTRGAGATVKGVGEEVERALRAVTGEAEERVREIIEAGRQTLAGSLDPDVRSSATARTLVELSGIHDALLARLIAEMTSLLDPAAGDSAMGRLITSLDSRFRDLRDLIAS